MGRSSSRRTWGIVHLVHAIYSRGYRTTGSCEHLPGTEVAYIAFEKRKDAETFAEFIDGTILDPTAEEREQAKQEDDPFLVGDAVAVAFPADSIADVLAQVEGTR